MTSETITFTLPANWVWGLTTLAFLVLASFAVATVGPKVGKGEPWLERAKSTLGLTGLNSGLFMIAALMWSVLFSILFAGLLSIIWQVILTLAPDSRVARTDWRFLMAQLAGLTAVLGAVVTLPVTLTRLRLQREADRTSKESLFNEKINAATEDLYARRQYWDTELKNTTWHDDITRRNAAIDRLEGLVKERPDEAERVSRLLSVYVRELSAESEFPAKTVPKDAKPDDLRKWARALSKRSDMENAVQTLGRLRGIPKVAKESVRIDLRGANLQAIDFEGGNFDDAQMQNAQMQGADLRKAQMQGAKLIEAQMQGADLSEAQMQGADLIEAQMQGAVLIGAQMQGADLYRAQMQEAYLNRAQMQGTDLNRAQMQGAYLNRVQMQGANLSGAKFDEDTNLTDATLRGASVRFMNDTILSHLEPFWQDIFADGTVSVPKGQRPSHWAEEELVWYTFDDRWRSWQRSIGQDPDNPE